MVLLYTTNRPSAYVMDTFVDDNKAKLDLRMLIRETTGQLARQERFTPKGVIYAFV